MAAREHGGKPPDIVVARCAGSRRLVRRGQLHPCVAAIEQASQCEEGRRIRRDGRQELARVIDDDTRRQPRQRRLDLAQRAAVELQVDMPAERRDPRGHPLQIAPLRSAARQHHEAHAAHAGGMQTFQLGLRHVDRYRRDAARLRAQCGQGVERAPVVEAIAGRLHDDHTREAERLLHAPIGSHRRMGRSKRRRRRERIRIVVDVDMAIARVGEPRAARLVARHRPPGATDACDARQRASRVACAALTAPVGTRPSSNAASWSTVSSA